MKKFNREMAVRVPDIVERQERRRNSGIAARKASAAIGAIAGVVLVLGLFLLACVLPELAVAFLNVGA